MRNPRSLLFNIAFALNCLLAFLVLFDEQLQVPKWLQVAGRMHPLILHFPIVLLVLCIFWELLVVKRIQQPDERIGDALLMSASLAAVVTALMGLFLSREDAYTSGILVWHKWAGVIISFLTLAWYAFRKSVRQNKLLLVSASVTGLVMIIVTGHQGANITHGENFLLAPVMNDMNKPPVKFEDALVYEDVIHPILQAKCISCHNSGKAKGELVMETADLLLKGGKHGALWDTTENEMGLLLQRIHLPDDNKKHMPPIGKPALTPEEIEILYRWIKKGSTFTARLSEVPPGDSLRILAANNFITRETDIFSFASAGDDKISKLNNAYRIVVPVATGSPGLNIEFFGVAQYKPEQLKELLEVKNQVVWLNLNKMPVTDEDLKIMGQFINLRKLNLSFTKITGATLNQLSGLNQLRELSLSGTPVRPNQLASLAKLPKLSELMVWKSNVQPRDVAGIEKQLTNVKIETGFMGDTIMLTLTPPIIENEEVVINTSIPLKLKHYIGGVTIRYTTDGTEPDSLKSPVYTKEVPLDKNLTVKTRAFKKGWIGSAVAEKTFFKSAIKPNSILLVTAPNPDFKGSGGKTIIDGIKGELNFRSGKWLGYKERPMEAYLYFNNPTVVSSISFSMLVDINSYIMPPKSIEVWGGSSPGSIKLLKTITPVQPTMSRPAYITGYDVALRGQKEKFMKLVIKPVPVLPKWHRGKGDKAWAFIDELFLN